MRCRAALITFGLLTAPLWAGWKITTVTSSSFGRWSGTSYYRNGMERTDAAGPSSFVTVLDPNRKRAIGWDLERREYWIRRFYEQRPPEASGGPVYVIDIESRDTGERRTMLGREVRHVITEERRHEQDGPVTSEIHIDGWYYESNSLPPAARAHTALFAAVDAHSPLPRVKINQRGFLETGLPVSTITTSIQTDHGARAQSTSQVTELVEAPLHPALFEPPADFHRAYHYETYAANTWRDKALLCWDWIEDRLGLP